MASRTLAWLVVFALCGALALRVQSLVLAGLADVLLREQAVYRHVRDLIRARYVMDIDEAKERVLFYSALEGMASKLDAHSHFYQPEDYASFKSETSGEFHGVGIELEPDQSQGVVVLTPIQDTPAWHAGILPGDRILKIDGQPTAQLAQHEAARRIRGLPGTKVILSVLHEGEKEPLDLTLTRAVIEIKSVPVAEILGVEQSPRAKIGYVQLEKFQQRTAPDLSQALKRLEALGMEALIVDLRQNPGGLLRSAEEVADLFLLDGPIVTISSRENGDELRSAVAAGTHPDYPLALLIDTRSASASEVVAGALQDRGRAILVGDKSYGKASVQEVIPVPLNHWGEAALKLTTARYVTPKGTPIDGQGIAPDYLLTSSAEQQQGLRLSRMRRRLLDNNPRPDRPQRVPRGLADNPQNPFVDHQLKKAIEILGQRVGRK